MSRAVVFIITFLAAMAFRAEASCVKDAVIRCTAAPLIGLTMSAINLTDSVVNQTCGHLRDITPCFSGMGCMENDTEVGPMFRGLRDGLTFLCGEGRQAWIANQQCLRSADMEKNLASCSATYGAKNETNPKLMCTSANGMLACMRTFLTSCNPDGSKVYITYTYKLIQPAASTYNCTLDQRPIDTTKKLSAAQSVRASSWTILGAVLLSTLTLLLRSSQ